MRVRATKVYSSGRVGRVRTVYSVYHGGWWGMRSNTWGNRAEVGTSGTGKRVRIGICRGKGGQSGVGGTRDEWVDGGDAP